MKQIVLEYAERALLRYKSCPNQDLAEQIADTADSIGTIEVWLEVFREEPQVIEELKAKVTHN